MNRSCFTRRGKRLKNSYILNKESCSAGSQAWRYKEKIESLIEILIPITVPYGSGRTAVSLRYAETHAVSVHILGSNVKYVLYTARISNILSIVPKSENKTVCKNC